MVKYLELGLMENKSANYKKISQDKVATLKYWIESAVEASTLNFLTL